MFRQCALLGFLCLSILPFSSGQLYAQEEEGGAIIVRERVGKEIGEEGGDRFSLSQGVEGSRTAVPLRVPDNASTLRISVLDEATGELTFAHSRQSGESTRSVTYEVDHPEEVEGRKPQDQQTVSTEVYGEPGTAFFFELLGKPYPSINMDFPINESSRFNLGVMYYFEKGDEEEGEDDVNSFMPTIMYCIFEGRNNRFEKGIGFGVVPVWREDVEGFPLGFFGVIGYRYQRKNRPLFRIGFTPCLYPGAVFLPWLGISLGYSL